ncbi:MAG: CsbD family protein [Gemmatimonadaceae bacterium]
MKSSTRNQAKGKLHEIKGAAKEAAGKLTKDPDLEDEGTIERTLGTVQKKAGQLGKVFEK